MKPGSLVVCVMDSEFDDPNVQAIVKWMPVPDSETIYTVREVRKDRGGVLGVYLEEGVVGYHPRLGDELAIGLPFLKEIQPPEEVSISALMEEVNEKELFAV